MNHCYSLITQSPSPSPPTIISLPLAGHIIKLRQFPPSNPISNAPLLQTRVMMGNKNVTVKLYKCSGISEWFQIQTGSKSESVTLLKNQSVLFCLYDYSTVLFTFHLVCFCNATPNTHCHSTN